MSQAVQPLKLRSEKIFASQIEEFKATEEEGRRRAYDREGFPYDDVSFLQRVDVQSATMDRQFHDFNYDNEARFADMVGMAAFWAISYVRTCMLADIRRKDCIIAKKEPHPEKGKPQWVDIEGRESIPFSALEMADSYSQQLTGRRCTYLRGTIDPYTESAFLNDLTSCFHTVMDIYKDKVGKWRIKGKCMWSVV